MYLDVKVIGLYVDNSVSVSYFRSIYCVESVGFLFLIPWEAVSVYCLWGDEVPLCSAVDER
jgi:hypothetical protein